jgi:uncharacterized membrane protein HdeD (DUF308 family)
MQAWNNLSICARSMWRLQTAACGASRLSRTLPTVSSMTASLVLGIALIAAGLLKIGQAFRVRHRSGFVWYLLMGSVEVVGGILIYLNPLKRAIAIVLCVGLILAVQPYKALRRLLLD